jgi:YYY domain-containing protein
MQTCSEILRWYSVLVGTTWALAPMVSLLCRSLPSNGVSLVRPLALLAVVYPVWLLASLQVISVSTWMIWLSLGGLALANWAIGWRRSLLSRAWLTSMGWAELLALVSFGLYAGWRGFAPWILNTEKPMEIAFLASSMRSPAMPPTDPWFAGESINYYYLGYVLFGSVARLAQVPPTVAFNLALATVFSMTVTAASGVAFGWVRHERSRRIALTAGALAVVGVVLAGNLETGTRLIRDPAATITAPWWQGVGWGASRIFVDHDAPGPILTINEFPAFSFVLGDLHPHLMALPYLLTVLGLAGLLARADTPGGWRWLTQVAVIGAIAGVLGPLNSWDYPLALLLCVLALLMNRRVQSVRHRGRALLVLIGSSLIAWAPFYAAFDAPVPGQTTAPPSLVTTVPGLIHLWERLGIVMWERTSVSEFLTAFGWQYGVALLLLAALWTATEWRQVLQSTAVIAGGLVVVLVALLSETPVLLLCGIPLLAAVALLDTHGTLGGTRMLATTLIGVAFTLLIGMEVIYLRDVFANRMNTVFKLSFQIWIVLGMAIAVGLSEMLARIHRPRRRFVASAALITSIGLLLTYPALSAYRYTEAYGPAHWQGLDGAAYIGDTAPDELAALRWLSTHASVDDVILEAQSCAYQPWGGIPTARVSAFTGVPTVLGWANHEGQWRASQPTRMAQIDARGAAIAAMYADPSLTLVETYGVTLLYVGPYEREGVGRACPTAGPYPAVLTAMFPGPGWELAFSSREVAIYRRIPSRGPST